MKECAVEMNSLEQRLLLCAGHSGLDPHFFGGSEQMLRMARSLGGLLFLLALLVSCNNDSPPLGQDPGLTTAIPRGGMETISGEGADGVFIEGRTVELRAFAIAARETSWDLWREVCLWAASNGYRIANQGTGLAGADPVTDITWRDAIVWCNAYSEMTGLDPVYFAPEGTALRESLGNADAPGVTSPADRALMRLGNNGCRLPLEAEWEFAARNPGLGLFAMNDGIAEWCWDWFHENGITADTPVTGDGPGEFAHRVIRGGGWSDALIEGHVTNRNYFRPFSSSPKIGFRVARSL
jgi:formylglycine-generating enzyme required for sulfatase activity